MVDSFACSHTPQGNDSTFTGSLLLQNQLGIYVSGALVGYALLLKQEARRTEGELNGKVESLLNALEVKKNKVRPL